MPVGAGVKLAWSSISSRWDVRIGAVASGVVSSVGATAGLGAMLTAAPAFVLGSQAGCGLGVAAAAFGRSATSGPGRWVLRSNNDRKKPRFGGGAT